MRINTITIIIFLFVSFLMALAGATTAQPAPTGGVGLALYSEDDGSITVRGLLPDGPAEKAGIRVGDVLVSVEDAVVGFEAAGRRLRGEVGTAVKLTVRRDGKGLDFTLTRAAINLPPMAGKGGAPANPPAANPLDIAPGKTGAKAPVNPLAANPLDIAPRKGGAPVNPLAANPLDVAPGKGGLPMAGGANGLPPFLKPGFRLSWLGGNSTIAGSHLVPDANGWIESQGQKFSLKKSSGSGGMGYTQINIVHAEPQLIVADIRMFLIVDLENGICVSKDHALLVGNGDALGDFWMNPARLAAMPDGAGNGESVTRGGYALGGREYKSISIRHQGQDGYSSRTYDRETGLMLFGGTTDIDPTVLIGNREKSGIEKFEGNKQYSHNHFVSVRETKIPWAGSRMPQALAMGRRLEYTGMVSHVNDPSTGLPPLPGQASTLSYEVDKELAADCVAVKLLARFDLGQGIPPNEVRGARTFGSAMLGGFWIPPDALRTLQSNQVLDEDPVTRYRLSVGGVQGNVVTSVEQGPKDVMEQSYDVNSGMMVGSRYSVQQGNLGQMLIQYRLAGGN